MIEVNKHIIFLKVYLISKLTLILTDATTSFEHAFSAIKLIMTDIHNKMGDEFFEFI